MSIKWCPLGELTVEALKTTPIWEWRENGGAEEVRPTSLDCIPEADGNAVHLVFTKFSLADGKVEFGYCSPGDDSGLDYIQPVIICEEIHWNLLDGEPPQTLSGKNIFPLKFECLVPCDGKYLKQTIEHSSKKEPHSNG